MSTSVVLHDRYELMSRLFSEGNQAAYAARDRQLGREVLLFLIPPSKKLGEKADRAVRAGIEDAFELEAPSLLPLLDYSESGDWRFLVMPMPSGTNAWTRITGKKAAGKRLDVDAVLRVGDDLIAAAEATADGKTILGFSPKQVWIDEHGAAEVQYYWLERVHTGDSDLAESTGIKAVSAEAGYFHAPELAHGDTKASQTTDQFFIAAILYGLLTGEVPGGTLTPIRRTRKDVPRPLAKAVERGLAREPASRHADLASFRRALHKQPARLGALLPVFVVLAALWTAYALFQGGADLDDWAFPAEIERRRHQAFLDSRSTAAAVPMPDAAAVARFAGRYESAERADQRPVHVLRLRIDGSFVHVDRSRDAPRRVRGIWWRDAEIEDDVHLGPVSPGADRPKTFDAHVHDGGLELALPVGGTVALQKVAWARRDGSLGPLVELELPRPGTVQAETEVRVTGRVALDGTVVRVGTTDVPVVGDRFDTVLEADAAREVRVEVDAVGPGGFRARVERAVRVDAGPPRITATAALRSVDGTWRLRVDGRGEDDGPVPSIRVNDEPVEPDDEGAFTYEREGSAATAHAFVEITAVDSAGREARRVLWANVVPVKADALAPMFERATQALEGRRASEAEDVLREIRRLGGLIEKLPPDKLERLVHQGRTPGISLDNYAKPPAYFANDGSNEVVLSGRITWLGSDDTLSIRGRKVALDGGRFETRVPLPTLGANTVALQVMRDGKPVATRAVEVLLAAPDGEVPSWTGVPVTEAQRAASARDGIPIGRTNGLGMRFVLIPPGVHRRATSGGTGYDVELTRPYYMQVREVSRRDFERLTGLKLPTVWKARGGELAISGAQNPATGMSRAEAIKFAEALSKSEGATYRLPTEAEWEYAARAGDLEGGTYWGTNLTRMTSWANYADKKVKVFLPFWPSNKLVNVDDGAAGTWAVGSGAANAFGCRDMLGNAAEWVADSYAAYDPREMANPFRPATTGSGIVRGGSFRHMPETNAFAHRREQSVRDRDADVGFRLVLESGVR